MFSKLSSRADSLVSTAERAEAQVQTGRRIDTHSPQGRKQWIIDFSSNRTKSVTASPLSSGPRVCLDLTPQIRGPRKNKDTGPDVEKIRFAISLRRETARCAVGLAGYLST